MSESGPYLGSATNPPKEPVRMSLRLRSAINEHRQKTGLRFFEIAARAGIDRSMLSTLMHGKVVGRGDERLAKVGRYMWQIDGVAPEEWEEPA